MLSKNNNKNVNKYLRFSSMVIQMGAIIAAGALGGQWIDGQIDMEFPLFTLILSLVAVFGSLFMMIKEVIDQSKKDD